MSFKTILKLTSFILILGYTSVYARSIGAGVVGTSYAKKVTATAADATAETNPGTTAATETNAETATTKKKSKLAVETKPAPNTIEGLYLEGNFGLGYRPWHNYANTPFDFFLNNHNSRFSAIIDLGYQINKFVSFEAGWIHLSKMNSNIQEIPVFDSSEDEFFIENITSPLKLWTWSFYVATKLTVPLTSDLYLFGKFGPAYVNNSTNFSIFTSDLNHSTKHSNYWVPMFAFGTQYYFTANISINLQYIILPGFHSVSSRRFLMPNTNIFTVGFGYKFLT